MLRLGQRGDTIIEVLLAVTVFSLVSVGAITIMNQSANAAQQAIEITLVRQQIDAQVEALRAAHQAHARMTTDEERSGSVWRKITAPGMGARVATSDGCPSQGALNQRNPFAMNPKYATVLTNEERDLVLSIETDDAPVFPQIASIEETTLSYGLWIESEKITANDGQIPAAYNFRVRACWAGPGTGDTPMQLETTVRLYDVE